MKGVFLPEKMLVEYCPVRDITRREEDKEHLCRIMLMKV